MAKKVFEVKDVSMDFRIRSGSFYKKKKLRALDAINFELYEGESLAVVGESGSGKSTLCRLAMCFHKPTSGVMFFFDENEDPVNIHTMTAKQRKQYRRQAQMIFQDPFSSLNPLHSIDYHVRRPLELYYKDQYNSQQMNAKVKECLEMVGISPAEEQAHKYPHQLSGGQKQRVYLARILAVGAQLIFADEPTSMLDVSIRLGVLNLMNDMKRDMGKSFVYITHDMATARYFADRILVMFAGVIVESGQVDEVILKPKHPYTKLLIQASPDANKSKENKFSDYKNVSGLASTRTIESIGCPFFHRCPVSLDICKTKMPELKSVSENQQIRCFQS